MKANQKFANADEAVSPVIGVILMVAITVVLAAVVFVLVSDLGGDNNSAPAVSFNTDEADDQISLIKGPSGVNWNEFEIRMSVAGQADLNDPTTIADIANELDLAANTYATGEDASLSGGDYLQFCTDAAGTDVTVLVKHTASNQVVYETQFSSIAVCA